MYDSIANMVEAKFMIDTIMIFAAGYGSRMKHLSENQPKCLIHILDKPILYYVLELISQYPFKKIVINTHYLKDQISDAIDAFKKLNKPRAEIIIVHEPSLLETGGTVKNTIDMLGASPIFTINSDIILKSNANIFEKMQSRWLHEKMDFLLLLQPCDEAIGYTGYGDFEISKDGALVRPVDLENYQYMYAGVSILKPNIIANNPLKIFSLKDYYINSNKVFGVVIPNTKWYHATSPEDIVDIEFDLLK